MLSMIKNRGRGFSLMEILIVIAILAIVAAVAVPSLMASLNASKGSAINESLAAYSTAIKQTSLKSTDYRYVNALHLSELGYLNGNVTPSGGQSYLELAGGVLVGAYPKAASYNRYVLFALNIEGAEACKQVAKSLLKKAADRTVYGIRNAVAFPSTTTAGCTVPTIASGPAHLLSFPASSTLTTAQKYALTLPATQFGPTKPACANHTTALATDAAIETECDLAETNGELMNLSIKVK